MEGHKSCLVLQSIHYSTEPITGYLIYYCILRKVPKIDLGPNFDLSLSQAQNERNVGLILSNEMASFETPCV